MQFRKAERKQSKLRLAITGPSGSGKTYSALRLATGLGGKIAMIDTESGRGELYATEFEYDVCPLSPPFTPKRYIEAIRAAEAAGYDVLVIDSISHEWQGDGGCLDMQTAATMRSASKNSYTAWKEVTPEHNKFVDAIIQSRCHVIATMRSKQDYAQVEDGNGRKKVEKLGMAPIQREGLDYEFVIVFDMDRSHKATCSKDNTHLFDGQYFQPSEESGRAVLDWLMSGKPADAPAPKDDTLPRPDPARPAKPTKGEIDSFSQWLDLQGLDGKAALDILSAHEGRKFAKLSEWLDEHSLDRARIVIADALTPKDAPTGAML